jgi:predicted DNA-binding mobile mystery protein A
MQVDKRIKKFAKITEEKPPRGWIYTIRTALGMSMRQLGNIINITPQAVKNIESREQTGNITIRALEQLGRKMNMKLVYGFVPMEGSLQKKIDHKAISVAKKIVMKTSGNMSLEAQNVSSAMLKKAINAKAKELRQKKLKWLWE